MNDTTQPSAGDEDAKNAESERTKQVTVAGWTAGVSAFFALGTLSVSPTWPMAVGVAVVAAMVAAACYFILKKG